MEPGIHDVLFVCTGNICRSPMAAALLAGARTLDRTDRRSTLPLTVASAGLRAVVGAPVDSEVEMLMRQRGIDVSAHRARQATVKILAAFELILVMDEKQRHAVEQMFPAARGRVHRLGGFGNFDIPDPYGKPRAAFEHSLALIERGIDDYVRAFWSAK